MPDFKLSTKSNWNSSKKKGRKHQNRATTQKKWNNNKSNTKGKSKPKPNKSKTRQKNSGSDAAIRPANALNSPKFKRNENENGAKYDTSKRQAKLQRRKALLARSRYVSKEEQEAPKSFVVTRGQVTKKCQMLREDLRAMFSPYTAQNLKERKKASLQDYIHASSDFGVTHLITLSQSDTAGTMLRMIRLPRGPTFWFRVKEYALLNDILSIQKKQLRYKVSLRFPALVILNGFSQISPNNNDSNNNNSNNSGNNDASDSEPSLNVPNAIHKNLMAAMFKHMFPPMNVASMRLNNCKRVVFFSYNNNNHSIDIRHYKIKIAPIGISRPLKKLIRNPILQTNNNNNNVNKYKKYSNNKNKKNKNKTDRIPDLSKFNDISDYIENKSTMNNSGYESSDSEAEDNEATRIILPQSVGHNKSEFSIKSINNANDQCAVRLKEIGPRITIELIKIEELVNDGRVLYHRLINKTNEEIEMLELNKQKQIELKEDRKRIQEKNIQKKVKIQKQKKLQRLEKVKEKQVSLLLKRFENENENNNDNNKQNDKQKKGILKKKRNLTEMNDSNNGNNTVSFKRGNSNTLSNDASEEPAKKRQKLSNKKKPSKRSVRFDL